MKEKGFISIENLIKTFKTSDGERQVLKGINLSIEQGDIYGIIGMSGAGKSTLVRCINRLEEPTSGEILVNGINITKLNSKELKQARKNIGMIFQDFSLFDSKTVYKNIEFPLNESKISKDEKDSKIKELIELVDLSEQINYYPAQLSGGQKQRVGIARALATNPDVLLCDEATSSLDPETTLSVLDLLKNINKELNLTIIMISHEFEVIKYACNHVGIIENGLIVEEGPVEKIINRPESKTGKTFQKVEKKLREVWKEREITGDIRNA